jgi:phosphatidylglycerol:prolipoprotein diacylglycerol transferase
MEAQNYTWWNLLPFNIDNTFITLFSNDSFFHFGSSSDASGLPIRFYGLMYLAAFYGCFSAMKFFNKKYNWPLTNEKLDIMLSYIIAGILLGGRLGYVLFYNFTYYLSHPLEIIGIRIDNGISFAGISGMSYHGGMLGAIVGAMIFCHREKVSLWLILNLGFLCAPIGYTFGRIGNFLNGELYGRETTSALGMVFPNDPDKLLRHPSQLYEAVFEGPVLFVILIFLWQKESLREHMLAFYLMGYGLARFFIEYVRQPDAHIGIQAGFTRGQYLCLAMIIGGIALGVYREMKIRKAVVK